MKIRKKQRYEWFFLKHYINRLSDSKFDELITARKNYRMTEQPETTETACGQNVQLSADQLADLMSIT